MKGKEKGKRKMRKEKKMDNRCKKGQAEERRL